MIRAVIDSSAWIRARRSPPEVARRIATASRDGHLALCEPVRLELLRGARSGLDAVELDDALGTMVTLPADDVVWRLARRTLVQLAHLPGGRHREPQPRDHRRRRDRGASRGRGAPRRRALRADRRGHGPARRRAIARRRRQARTSSSSFPVVRHSARSTCACAASRQRIGRPHHDPQLPAPGALQQVGDGPVEQFGGTVQAVAEPEPGDRARRAHELARVDGVRLPAGHAVGHEPPERRERLERRVEDLAADRVEHDVDRQRPRSRRRVARSGPPAPSRSRRPRRARAPARASRASTPSRSPGPRR